LRADAKGVYCAEAAVELLIGHGWWLYRDDFVDAFVATDHASLSGMPVAWVDWPATIKALDGGRLPCSASEAQALRLAASIADGVSVDLREALCGLDADTVVVVARAVAHAGGHRDAAVVLAGARP
jgi:hypothetical protein